jgi:hypothetical protein
LNRGTSAVLKLEATMGRLTDVVGAHVADLREERQEREIEEEVDRRLKLQLREQRARQKRVSRPRPGA